MSVYRLCHSYHRPFHWRYTVCVRSFQSEHIGTLTLYLSNYSIFDHQLEWPRCVRSFDLYDLYDHCFSFSSCTISCLGEYELHCSCCWGYCFSFVGLLFLPKIWRYSLVHGARSYNQRYRWRGGSRERNAVGEATWYWNLNVLLIYCR